MRLEQYRGHTFVPSRLNPESVVIDAGAHRGEFSRNLMHRYGCQPILVEANPQLAALLTEQNFPRVLSAGLMARDGRTAFFQNVNLEAGGICDPSQSGRTDAVEIEMLSLETVVKRFSLARIDLLKLDIEGAEFELIDKTSDITLSSIGQITVEFHDFMPKYKNRNLYQIARKRLEALGFITCCMTFRTHGDVLFLNRKMFASNVFSRLWLRFGARWFYKLKSFSMQSYVCKHF